MKKSIFLLFILLLALKAYSTTNISDFVRPTNYNHYITEILNIPYHKWNGSFQTTFSTDYRVSFDEQKSNLCIFLSGEERNDGISMNYIQLVNFKTPNLIQTNIIKNRLSTTSSKSSSPFQESYETNKNSALILSKTKSEMLTKMKVNGNKYYDVIKTKSTIEYIGTNYHSQIEFDAKKSILSYSVETNYVKKYYIVEADFARYIGAIRLNLVRFNENGNIDFKLSSKIQGIK